MMCSARSLGSARSSSARARSSASSLPRRRVPARGRTVTSAVLDPDQDLGRAADQVEVAEVEVEEERARVDHPEDPVDVERLGRRLDLEPLAGHDLEDVAGLDVLLAVADDVLVRLAGEVRLAARGVTGPSVSMSSSGSSGPGVGQPGDQLVDPAQAASS